MDSLSQLVDVCTELRRNDVDLNDGFCPHPSTFWWLYDSLVRNLSTDEEIGKNEIQAKLQPQIFVKCVICDNTNDSVNVIPFHSKKMQTFSGKFVFLQCDSRYRKIGDTVLIRSDSYYKEYYLSMLLEYNKYYGNWKVYSPVLGRDFWKNEKDIIIFNQFLSAKKMSMEYILNK